MNSRLWVRALFAALFGHLAAVLIAAFLTYLALYLQNPSSAVLPIAYLSLGVGAFVVALKIRRDELGVSGAALGGIIFIFPLLICSCLGKGEVHSWGVVCLLLLAAMTVIMTVVLLFPKAKKRNRRKKTRLNYRR